MLLAASPLPICSLHPSFLFRHRSKHWLDPPAASPAWKFPRLTLAEIHQQMLERGLITQLPDPAQDIDDDPDDRPVPIKGEPLSETIIRERR